MPILQTEDQEANDVLVANPSNKDWIYSEAQEKTTRIMKTPALNAKTVIENRGSEHQHQILTFIWCFFSKP